MITQDIKKSPIFVEFEPQAQEYWFDHSRDKVLSHIDTFYYSVSIQNDYNDNPLISYFVEKLFYYKNLKRARPSNDLLFSNTELTVELRKFSIYDFCFSLNENFDIFIASYIPNDNTPRIVVQLRTRSLILNGVLESLKLSYNNVCDILRQFELLPGEVRENRIDYAYHTNLIQNPYDYFSDNLILDSMKSKLRLFHKVGNIRGDKIYIDYFSLGNRSSNNVFVRIYNKTQEVIEKNYKSFFISRWRENKLINRYDEYVYERAFEYNTYYTGILLGKIEWYLTYGTNDAIKKELLNAKVSCYDNSDNLDHLSKVVKRYLPDVTLIMNVEFQTKRKFYHDMESYLKTHTDLVRLDDLSERSFWKTLENPLHRLNVLYDIRADICHYLTTQTLSFVDKKGKKDESYKNWWQRIINSRIDSAPRSKTDLWRDRESFLDCKRAKKRLLSTVAHFNLLNQNIFDDNLDFVEDLSDVLCTLNDNDFYGFAPDPLTGKDIEFNSNVKETYSTLKKRKQRQLKPILKKLNNESEK